MSDVPSTIEHIIPPAEVKTPEHGRKTPLVHKVKRKLQTGEASAHDILQALSDQGEVQKTYIGENILDEKEQQVIGKLRTAANYLIDQKAIFGLMGFQVALELVREFSGIQIPNPAYDVLKHGANAGIGSLLIPAGEGHLVSKMGKKGVAAAGFAFGVHEIEKLSGFPSAVVGLVDDVFPPFAKKLGPVARVVKNISKNIRK